MSKVKKIRWRKLDNAAKIFPATNSGRDTRVFRFYCELKETIEEERLQKALELSLEKYPIFMMVLRKGLFWFYLEPSDLKAQVSEEHGKPCGHIYIPDKKNLLFEVTYYKNRINFEVFHALTDGTGATQFLCEIVSNYLRLAHGELKSETESPTSIPPVQEQETDSFSKYYAPPKGRTRKRRAYQLKGSRLDYGTMQITEYRLSVKEILQKARSYGVSMTVYLSAVFLCAIHGEMSLSDEKRPAVLMVPVNLRKFFPSDSMLNFFGWVDPGFQFQQDTKLSEVIEHVKSFFKEELLTEKVAERMNAFTSLEKNPFLRAVPLELKNVFLQAGAKLSAREITAVLSNMSAVKMPEEFSPYIDRFGVYTSTDRLELCVCSYQDVLSLGFTTRKDCEKIIHEFREILEQDGIKVQKVEENFPEPSKSEKEGIRFFQWFTFWCIAMAVAGIVINMSTTPKIFWCLFSTAGIGSLWIVTSFGFKKRRNLMKNAMWQLIIFSIGSLLWDLATGWKDWSITFVWPIGTVLALGFMLVISKIQRLNSSEYIIYYCMASVFGLVPALFVALHLVSTQIPSMICGGVSVLFLAALGLFRKKELVAELHKKFHV